MMDIKLEGVAGKRFGRNHKLAVSNPKEAIRALCQLIPGFREFLTSAHELGIFFQIVTSHSSNNSYEELGLGCSSFSLVPVITGAMGLFKNIGLILVGVLLVALSMGVLGVTFSATAGTISAGLQTAIMSLGFALIFTGIAGLFAPGAPEDGKQEGSEANDAVFGGMKGTSNRGSVLPLLYGEFLVANMPVISSYVQTDSKDEAGYLLQIISEGPIEGLATGSKKKDLYFNGLQLTGTSIDDGDIEITDGAQTDDVIKNIRSAGFHLSVGATLGESASGQPDPTVIRSFNQPNADELRLRILRGPCYQLLQQTPNEGGSPETKYRGYADETKPKDKVFSEMEQFLKWEYEVFDGLGNSIERKEEYDDDGPIKSQQLYELSPIDISDRQPPISIRIKRIDKGPIPDPYAKKGGANTYSHQWAKGNVQFVSADVMWHEKLIYPFTALMSCKFEVGEFTQMPTVQGLFKGLKIKTVNRDLSTTLAWSDNPAFVLLDLLTNPRYGCGTSDYQTVGPNPKDVVVPGISIDDVDLASIRVAAEYCEEHDIKFNAYINRGADALDLIRAVASSFQASLIYYGGKVTVVIDKKLESDDRSSYRLFTEANVIQEVDESGEVTEPCFSYEGTAKKARTTAIEVSFVDPNLFYQEQKESIEDTAAIERYGYNHKRVRAMGCTSRAQARRFGRYILASNLLNTETVAFKVASEGAVLLPGDICVVADPLKTQVLSGGRISTATSNTVVLDRSPSLPSGTWHLYTYSQTGIAQRSQVTSINGNVCNVLGFNSVPTSSHVWLLVDEASEKHFRRYRVQSVKDNSDGTYEVIGILYTDRKFEYVETGDLDLGNTYNSFKRKKVEAITPSQISFSIRNT